MTRTRRPLSVAVNLYLCLATDLFVNDLASDVRWPWLAALARSPIRVASPRHDRQEPLPVTPQQVAVRLAIVDKVDDVIEEPRQNQLRIGIADTDSEPRWR